MNLFSVGNQEKIKCPLQSDQTNKLILHDISVKQGGFYFMKKGLTELVIIIDKSGSMYHLTKDVVGGFNSLIADQKNEEGEVLVTTILFDTKLKTLHDRENIKNIKELTTESYSPNGCTALLDAVGYAVNHIKEIRSQLNEDTIPEHTIFSIMTDGLENSSVEYQYSAIKKMIEEQKKIGWEFIFQAANIDAFEEGDKLGIDKANISYFLADPAGVKMCFCLGSEHIKRKRKIKK